MKKLLSEFLIKLSKKITRKNLHKYIAEELKEYGTNKIKVLNVGSGGLTEQYLKSKSNITLKSLDIDVKRNPDFVNDITQLENFTNLGFKPDLVCCFEVLEHIKFPEKAISNIYRLIDKDTKVILSVPFNFPIHDEPNDYFRFTKFGLQHLFQNFSKVDIKERDGWIDTIFVFFVRLKFSKNFILKFISIFFIIVYFILYPFITLIQKFIVFKNITTGYFIIVKK